MRSEREINEQINSVLEKLSILVNKKEEEMGKPFEKRDHRLLTFILRECNVYNHSLSQLRWMLSE